MRTVATLLVAVLMLACAKPYEALQLEPGQHSVPVSIRVDLGGYVTMDTVGLSVWVSDAGPPCLQPLGATTTVDRGALTLAPGSSKVEIEAVVGHQLLLDFHFASPGAWLDLGCAVEAWVVPEAGYSYEITFAVHGARCEVMAERYRASEREPVGVTQACV